LTARPKVWYSILMKLIMRLKINQLARVGVLVAMLAGHGARAQVTPDVPPPAPTLPENPTASTSARSSAPVVTTGPVAPVAPAVTSPGPMVELPPEQDMPATELPRESAIENPLGQAHAMSGTAIGGYGELTLNAPANASAVVDLRRLVLYVGHNFSDHIRFYSELEIEHAVASASDRGEFEVEQAYLDGLFGPRLNLRGGLIIMPVGIINIYHEPPTFNGVDRPDVDLYVIPTTWREAGFGIFGEIATGLSYQLYLVTGFNANGFTAESGIAEGHQEAQFAAARDFGGVLRLAVEPRLGTALGVSAYAATSGNSLRSTVGNVPVGLIEGDARTRIGGFTARAELAFLFIGDAAALNQALLAGSPEQMAAGPVASRLCGGYLELGYDLLRFLPWASTQDLTLFGRFDHTNTQASVPAGFTANPRFNRTTTTAGLVYRPIPQIGLKGDYRRHEFGAGSGHNELAAAITWMF
jgi:hypothetical protein